MKRSKKSLRKHIKTHLNSSTSLHHQNQILKHLSPMLTFPMIKLEFIVDNGQKLMEAAFIGTVGDIMYIHVRTLLFLKNGDFFIY